MKVEDLLPFDPAIVPWTTHLNEWALCVTIEPEGRVWVEYQLMYEMLRADALNPNNLANLHGMLITIGGKVAAVFHCPEYRLKAHQVRAVTFTGNPVEMRVGQFGGELFVFLPRPEFEKSRGLDDRIH